MEYYTEKLDDTFEVSASYLPGQKELAMRQVEEAKALYLAKNENFDRKVTYTYWPGCRQLLPKT